MRRDEVDWVEGMNDAVGYIEENLDGEIDYRCAAMCVGSSVYHFQRVFSYMTGISLSEYIRRRRLTLAAFDLQSSRMKVVDVSVKYGYDSPTAFSRAFQAFHSMTPSEARGTSKLFTAYPPITFQISIKGVTAMTYRIEQREKLRIVGLKLTTTQEGGKNLSELPAFWEECRRLGQLSKIVGLINREPFGLLGVCVEPPDGGPEFDYFIAAATDMPAPEGMSEYIIPASQYAIFECTGPMPDAIQDLSRRTYNEWLPSSGYVYGGGVDIEVYSDGDMSSKDYKSEIWVPVTKK